MNRKEVVSLQEKVDEAAAVKATTPPTRDKNKLQILAEIRRMVTKAARCKIIILRQNLGKPGKPDDNLMPGWVRLPRVKIVQRPFCKEALGRRPFQ